MLLVVSLAGLGIAIVNDFKSIEGDRAMGLQSLPVAFGVDTAKWICAGTIDFTQVGPEGLPGSHSLGTGYIVIHGLTSVRCCAVWWVVQLGVAGYLAYEGKTTYALVLLGLIIPQIVAQFKYLLKDPIEYDVKYQVRRRRRHTARRRAWTSAAVVRGLVPLKTSVFGGARRRETRPSNEDSQPPPPQLRQWCKPGLRWGC